jgi:hypothetical protein
LRKQDILKEEIDTKSETHVLRLLLAHIQDLQLDMGAEDESELEGIALGGAHTAAILFRRAKRSLLSKVRADIDAALVI